MSLSLPKVKIEIFCWTSSTQTSPGYRIYPTVIPRQSAISFRHTNPSFMSRYTRLTKWQTFTRSEVKKKKTQITSLYPWYPFSSIYFVEKEYVDSSGSVKACKGLNKDTLKKCQVVGPPLSHDYPVHPFFLTGSRMVVKT